MAPVKYGDFAKEANDLFNNDYCFDRKFKLKTKTKNGFELTSEGSMKSSSNAVGGKLTSKFSLGNGVTINKLGVTHAGRFFADAGYSGAIKGLSLSTLVEDGGKIPPVGELGVTYKHDLFTLTTKMDAMNGPTLKETLSTQYENFLIGGEFKYNTGLDNKAEAALKDYNVGVAYRDGDLSVAATTKNKLSEFSVGVHHKLNKDVQIGATYQHGASKFLAFGAQYRVDNVTTFQGKVDSKGIVSVNAHQQVSPNMKLIASSQVNAASLSADTHRFGLQLQLS